MIKIYNSLTNKIEEFKPIKENELSMYVCGSTVYDDIHIGNSRPVVFFDTLARFFQYIGYKVRFVSNFTDIDDKIIKKALSEGVDESVISERYIKSIKDTYALLNCLPHYKNPKVTETMPQIIEFIQLLVDKGGAYVSGNDVYFDVSQVKDYGILSGQTVENLINGARIEENDKKHNPCDFNLWKETEVGKKWNSPWGEGRPGWHTECVVMINDIFKGKIDIHGGGLDLKFPHHDNEIAQASVAFNNKIANYWMHNGRIDLAGEKMSKSLGNVIWAKDLVKEIGYGPYRLMILNVPYRQPMAFKEEMISQAKTDYEKITKAKISFLRKLQIDYGIVDYKTEIKDETLIALENEFKEAMSDDFNTANAITALQKTIKFVNIEARNKEINLDYSKQLLTILDNEMWVLGIDFKVNALSEDDLKLVKEWKQARNDKDFAKADVLREEINKKGIIF